MKKFIYLIAVFSCLAFMLHSKVASATSFIGPDSDPIQLKGKGVPGGTQGRASYVVSTDAQVYIPSTTIDIFVPAKNNDVVLSVLNPDMCTNASKLNSNSYDQLYAGSPSGLATSYSFVTGGATVATTTGAFVASKSCDTSVKRVTLSGAKVDPDTGYKKYTMTAVAAYGADYINMFSLGDTNGVGMIFSQNSGSNNAAASASGFGYQLSNYIPADGNSPKLNNTDDVYYQTDFPFGSDCTVLGPTKSYVVFNDLDTGNPAIQNRDITLHLLGKQPGGSYQDIRLYQNDRPPRQYLSPPDGSGVQTLSGGNGVIRTLNFTALPGYQYRLYVGNIYYNNTLQFGLPYSAIYAYADANTVCQNASLAGTTSSVPAVTTAGSAIDWTHSLKNNGTDTARNVNEDIHMSISGSANPARNQDKVKRTVAPPNAQIAKGDTRTEPDSYTTSADDIGATICEWITWTSANGGSGASTRTCSTVAKQPKVQIRGGDLKVGGDVKTTTNATASLIYGSWVEYAAFINGTDQGGQFGSGGSLASGGSASQITPMTFANNTAGSIGKYDPSVNSTLTTQDLSSVMDLTGLPSCTANQPVPAAGGCSNPTSSAAITLTGNPSVTGTVYINAPKAAVTIKNDITYSQTAVPIGALPQVIINAASITIDQGVKNVDAWLLTSTGNGKISTCEVPTKGSNCQNSLIIHGPVATKDLSLGRTYGSDSASNQDTPAETFDLRADSYLWEYSKLAKNYTPKTVQIINLPPRY